MKYSLSCPAPCNKKISVDAQDDDDAVNKLLAAGREHAKESHPEMPSMTDEQMKGMVRQAMQKA